MLDTITVAGPWPLRAALPPRRLVRLPAEPGGGVLIRVDSTGSNVDYAEASLPALLFGNNGRLLTNQDELDTAFEHLRGTVLKLAEVPPVLEWQLRRLDLCWNFDLPARPFIYAHASLRIPGIRSMACLFGGGSGVSWRGTRSRFLVTLYDKSRKSGANGNVLRAEVRLCGRHLVRRFPHGEWRQFAALWQAFREVLTSIPPISKPEAVTDLATAVGMEPPEVRTRILARLAGRPERTFRRLRRRVESVQVPGPFNWQSYLSPDGPPNPIQVPTRAKRHRV